MSPVLTPLDFFFWVYAKDMVYKTAVNDIDYLKKKIKKILESVRSVTVDIIAATWRELRKRLVVIIEHNDDHVEAYHH